MLADALAEVLARRRPIRSPPRSSRYRRRGWSAGWRSASRTGSAPPAATASARQWRSAPPPRWSPSRSAGRRRRARRRPVAPGAGGVAAAGGASTRPPDEPWCAALAAHLRTRTARPGPPHGRSCSAPTPPTGPSCSAPGGRATTRASTADLRVAARAVAAAARADRRPRIPPSGSTRRARPCAPIPRVAALPERLSLFGPTRLAAQELAVLAALGEHRDVHLWLPHPSPALWATVAPGRAGCRRAAPTRPPTRPRTRCCPRSGATSASCRCGSPRPCPASSTSTTPCPEPPPTLLGRLQRDAARRPCRRRSTIASRRPLRRRCTPATGRTARSRCCARSCSACSRPIPTWSRATSWSCARTSRRSPRSISAAFGSTRGDGHPAHRLPVRLADRALRQVNPLLDVVARLLELADARLTARAGARPARRRARCAAASASTTTTSTGCASSPSAPACAGGSTRAHRRPFRLDGVRAEHLGGRARPAAARRRDAGRRVAGHRAAARRRRAGRHRARRSAGRVRRPARGRARGAVRRTSAGRVDGHAHPAPWTRSPPRPPRPGRRSRPGPSSPRRRTSRAARSHGAAGPRRRPRPARRAAARPSHPRGLPHRHAHRRHAGADALGAAPGRLPARARRRGVPARGRGRRRRRAGPPPAASASATPAAKTASSCSTRSWRPPSTWSSSTRAPTSAPALPPPARRAAGRAARRASPPAHGRRRRRAHPLQPFDARNFTPGARHRAVQLRPRRAGRGPRRRRAAQAAPPPFLPAPLPRPAPGTVRARRPGHLRRAPGQGLPRASASGLSLYADDEAPADALPVALDGLANVGGRRPAAAATGSRAATLDRCRQAEWRRGDLPPGALGDRLLAERARGRRAAGRGGRRVPGRARPTSTGTSTSGAARRHPRGRHGRRRCTGTPPCASSTPGSPRSSGCGRGCGWWRSPRPPTEPWRAVTVGRGASGSASPGRSSGRSPPDAARGGAGRAGRAARRRGCASRCRCRRSPATTTPGSGAAERERPTTRWPRRCAAWTNGRAPSAPTPSHERVWGRGRARVGALRRGRAAGRGAHPVRRARAAAVAPLLQVEDVVRR